MHSCRLMVSVGRPNAVDDVKVESVQECGIFAVIYSRF